MSVEGFNGIMKNITEKVALKIISVHLTPLIGMTLFSELFAALPMYM